jgi:death-on-curing protein
MRSWSPSARSSSVSLVRFAAIVEYLELGDYLLIAERVLGIDAHTLVRFARLVPVAESALAAPAAGFGEVEAYPDFGDKAAVLCSRIVRNHPMPDGNKRAAYLCLREFIARNGFGWSTPPGGVDETVAVIERLAAGELSEPDLAGWLRERIVATS